MEVNINRLHCPHCKLIWGRDATGRLKNCTKCGRKLVIKQFCPLIFIVGGVLSLAVCTLTLLADAVPVIWIGGALLGGSLIIRGITQWSTLRDLDGVAAKKPKKVPKKRKTPKPQVDHNVETITCGDCGTKMYEKKGKGIFDLTCSQCGRVAKVMT